MPNNIAFSTYVERQELERYSTMTTAIIGNNGSQVGGATADSVVLELMKKVPKAPRRIEETHLIKSVMCLRHESCMTCPNMRRNGSC